jgi:hypothetical protein
MGKTYIIYGNSGSILKLSQRVSNIRPKILHAYRVSYIY